MAAELNRMWRVERAPSSAQLGPDDLAWHEEPVPEPADGELVVGVRYAVVDPALWSALPAAPGQVVPGAGLGVVLASRDPAVPVKTTVSGLFGWQTHARIATAQVFVHGDEFTDEDYLGALNHIGATAYFGVREVAKPQSGETFVVTSAAAAIGSLAGQIAKLDGARVVGIAATPDQRAWLTDELGFDAVIAAPPSGATGRIVADELVPALTRACPDGIHALLDGMGGPVLDACFSQLAQHARVALFGSSPAIRAAAGPAYFPALAVRRVRVQGFSFLDYPFQFEAALAALAAWRKEGKLAYRLNITDGLEHAVAGLRRMQTDGDALIFRI